MIKKITNQNQIARHKLAEKINELIDAVNVLQAQVAILEEHAHPTATTKPAENVQDRMIGCITLDIPKSYKNDQLTLATLDYNKKLEKENSDLKDELERTRKALEIAVDALDAGRTLARIAGFEMLATSMDEALEKITTEQKDKRWILLILYYGF